VAKALVPVDKKDKDKDSLPEHDQFDLTFTVPADMPKSNVYLTDARIITMEGDKVIENGYVHVVGNRIAGLGPMKGASIPRGAKTIDCSGKTIMPGIVDVHAHMPSGNAGMLPQHNWAYMANLAFGVTTTHDPSHDTKMVFSASELVNTGQLLGPRMFSTGTILYGAEANFKAVINSIDDARSHLRRLKAFGAFSVKSYNQPRRDQRQQIIEAGAELKMMVCPEGGSMFFHNLTMILDGHTTQEHALPVAPLYEDVLKLFAFSRTAYNPTLVVGYGGLWGENYWYEETNVWENKRLLNFVPRGLVDARSRRRTKVPADELHHIALAKSAADLIRRGVVTSVSAHGQMQGICSHWDLWMFQQGGLSNHEALFTATINGARALGLDHHVGSLKQGKLADLIVLDKNPLENIRNSESIDLVMKNGRLYDSMSLRQLYPVRTKKPQLPFMGLLGDLGSGCMCQVGR
jgi:imidazolonepropionase-like amidohydrolase